MWVKQYFWFSYIQLDFVQLVIAFINFQYYETVISLLVKIAEGMLQETGYQNELCFVIFIACPQYIIVVLTTLVHLNVFFQGINIQLVTYIILVFQYFVKFLILQKVYILIKASNTQLAPRNRNIFHKLFEDFNTKQQQV